MQNVQNLTNRKVSLQGVSIEPYSTASFDKIVDYVGLSQLLNSGKVRVYATKGTTVKVEPVKVDEPVVVVEAVTEEKPEEVESVVEEVKQDVEPTTVEETVVTEDTELDFGKKSSKRKSSKK